MTCCNSPTILGHKSPVGYTETSVFLRLSVETIIPKRFGSNGKFPFASFDPTLIPAQQKSPLELLAAHRPIARVPTVASKRTTPTN